jgi:choline monooxygenase
LKGLVCKYHGWTFSLDGKLKGMPRFGETFNIDKNEYNLWPARLARWKGLLFVQMLPEFPEGVAMNGKQADELFLQENKDFCERLSHLPIEELELHSASKHSLACNWKVCCVHMMVPFMVC